jgi:ElaB/YqjD/DUF883 family membrane-anchored ribosome-binding protein
MDDRIEKIRQDMSVTRESLQAKLEQLETKARYTFSLRRRVSNRPWLALGAAVAAGFVVGAVRGQSGHEPER